MYQKNDEELEFVKLSEEHLEVLANFNCFDEDEDLSMYKKSLRRKFKNHTKDINTFIQEEALKEQELGLNTTHLLLKHKEVIGFVSLCSDSLRLELEEKEAYNLPYENIPSLKIARLSVDKRYQKCGLGKLLIQFSVHSLLKVREDIGIKFITVDCYKHRYEYYHHLGFEINKSKNTGKCSDSPISLRLNVDRYLEDM